MGGPMAGHLVAAGHEVLGFDPSPEARARAGESGVETVDHWSGHDVTVVLSSLPDGPQVEDVYRDLLPALPPGALCLDLSTIDVEVSRGLAVLARDQGHDFLDCPVSGTSVHARAGTLAVMVGGDAGAAKRARPYLEPFSSSLRHLGPNGAGLEMKLITNRLLNAHVVAIGEAIVEMEAAGLDTAGCIEVLREGAVPRLLDYKAGPMAERDFTPLFTVGLMAKDLRLAARRRPAGTVGGSAAEILFRAEQAGWGEHDIAAVIGVLTTR
jgi:3-hydroxyisobutyrate dehydrogenase-like beta-hydroxyacid dehydrogenase